MHTIKITPLGAVLAACVTLNVHAAPTEDRGEGALFTSIFGDSLEKETGIIVSGLSETTFSRNNRSTADERKGGMTNFPLIGAGDEGLEFGSLRLFIDKPLESNVIPRVTPLPGPTPENFSFGFTFEGNYGRNAQFARTFGWDMHWGVNSPGDDDPAKAQRDKQRFLAVPNLAATAYLPIGTGLTVMAGIFGPGIGYEIPPDIREARNAFATKTYALVSEPGTFSGVLMDTRLMSNASGVLGVELGVVQGWNNLRDNNDSKTLTGAVRWRTPDMKTWVDYEFVVGHEENSSTDDVQAPIQRLISPNGQLKQQHSLNGWHAFDEHWSMGAELVYGHQAGDGKPSTVDIVNGPGFDGAKWWGANAVVTYRYRKDLAFSVRGEHFSDPEGFALFPVSSARGDFNAVTAGFRYDVNRYLSLRPELRYDWFDGNSADHPFGNGRDRDQLTATVDALFYF